MLVNKTLIYDGIDFSVTCEVNCKGAELKSIRPHGVPKNMAEFLSDKPGFIEKVEKDFNQCLTPTKS